MSPRLQAALVLAGVFALGAVTGGAAVHFQHVRRIHAKFGGPPHQARLRGLLAALDREVDLDDAQRAKVREIVAAHEPEMKEIRRAAAPQLAAFRTKIAGEIRGVMRPEQMAAFDQFVKKQEERALDER